MTDAGEKRLLCVLAGPTASGKTGAALNVARMADMEIISADSMQVYRGMDIGTAKATREERATVKHHMIDVCGVEENYTVARYREEALRVMDGIYAVGKLPFIVGGTGLYISAVADELNFAGTQADNQLRMKWENYLLKHGASALHESLKAVDPEAAQKIHANNTRRVIRALEVYELTGETISSNNSRMQSPYDLRYAALRVDRQTLLQRIEQRVMQMFRDGLVEEARGIYETCGETARQALGYRQLFDYFDGKITLDKAREAIIIGTRQYAKRQMTWFRRDGRICWFNADDAELTEKLVEFYTSG